MHISNTVCISIEKYSYTSELPFALKCSTIYIHNTVQLTSKFTARIGQNAYLAGFFARHEELHAFDVRVSRLLTHATMLASCASCDLYVLTRIPTRDRFCLHENLLTIHFTQ